MLRQLPIYLGVLVGLRPTSVLTSVAPTREPTSLSRTSVLTSLAPTSEPGRLTPTAVARTLAEGQDFLNATAEAQKIQIQAFLSGTEARTVFSVKDATVVVEKLSLAGHSTLANQKVSVQSDDGVEVGVPISLLSRLGDVLMGVASFREGTFPFASASVVGNDNATRKVQATGVIDLYIADSTTGERLLVDNLKDTINITLAVNRTAQTSCAYWDEVNRMWSTEGLIILPDDPEDLEEPKLKCATRHLSFFAAISAGMQQALRCSNFYLFDEYWSGVDMFTASTWYDERAGVLVWVLSCCLLTILNSAIAVDFYRHRLGRGWHDEYFLIATGTAAEIPYEGVREQNICVAFILSCCTPVVVGGEILHDVIKDAIDEILVELFVGAKLIRKFVRHCLKLASGASEGRRLEGIHRTTLNAAEKLVIAVAMKAAAGKTMLCIDDMELVQEGIVFSGFEEVPSAKSDYTPNVEETDTKQSHATRSVTPEECGRNEVRIKALQSFQCQLYEASTVYLKVKSLRAIPDLVPLMLLYQSSIVDVFVFSFSTSSSMRCMYLMTDLVGTLMLVTLFGSGSIHRKRTTSVTPEYATNGEIQEDDACEPIGWDDRQIGKLIVIGVAASVLSALPRGIITSCHTRRFRQMDYKGSKAWTRQLRVWWFRDALTWLLGILYIAWCLNFSILFIASVVPQDHEDWLASMFTSIATDFAIEPICFAILLPFLAAFCSVVTHTFGKKKETPKVEDTQNETSEHNDDSAEKIPHSPFNIHYI